jgi:hypothetical protein
VKEHCGGCGGGIAAGKCLQNCDVFSVASLNHVWLIVAGVED